MQSTLQLKKMHEYTNDACDVCLVSAPACTSVAALSERARMVSRFNPSVLFEIFFMIMPCSSNRPTGKKEGPSGFAPDANWLRVSQPPSRGLPSYLLHGR
jgi:hypothetical protein